MNKKFRLMLPILILSFIMFSLIHTLIPKNQFCTIFTLNKNDTVLFGSNEDWHSDELYLGFFPGSADKFASVKIGYTNDSNQLNFVCALNEHGLIWAVNSLPKVDLNPHPERSYSHKSDNYLSAITNHIQTVDEAIALSRQFDFGTEMQLQFHIADASGDAVIISPGADGQLAYTRMPPDQGFLISSNFNHAFPGNGKQGWRYDTAYSMISQRANFTPDFARDVLSAVKLNHLSSFTLTSTVANLKEKEFTIYYLSQFDEGAVIQLIEEVSKGQRIVPLENFFSQPTVEAGKIAYRKFEIRFRLAQIGLILTTVLLFILIVCLLKKRRHQVKRP